MRCENVTGTQFIIVQYYISSVDGHLDSLKEHSRDWFVFPSVTNDAAIQIQEPTLLCI